MHEQLTFVIRLSFVSKLKQYQKNDNFMPTVPRILQVSILSEKGIQIKA